MMFRIALVAYALVAIVTFGNAASKIYESACRPAQMMCFPEEQAIYGGMLAAMGWPLYWSTRLQLGGRA